MQQLEDPPRALRGGEVEVGHPAAQQGVALAEVVDDVEPGQEPGELGARSLEGEQVGHRRADRLAAGVAPLEKGLHHDVPEDPGRRGVSLRLVRVEERLGRDAPDDLAELPPEVDRVL